MTFRAQCEAILDAGEWPGDAQVAEEIGCSLYTVQGCRQQWRRKNGQCHENDSGILPADVVDLIFFARDIEGVSWRKVAQAVREIYGLDVTASQCGNLYRRGGYKKPAPSPNIDPLGSYSWDYATPVPRYMFPLLTRVGIMWRPKDKAPLYQHKGVGQYKTACDYCPHRAWCQAHPGDVCGCETAWESEVM